MCEADLQHAQAETMVEVLEKQRQPSSRRCSLAGSTHCCDVTQSCSNVTRDEPRVLRPVQQEPRTGRRIQVGRCNSTQPMKRSASRGCYMQKRWYGGGRQVVEPC